mmetsp:Transcript_21156/g.31370  ORF Transcript_21156/g.31370 Transcript_21156/m.31370 type:complete len:495 (+) Transcript_21156:126-1610(+)|eukprot:CAMPEP_0194219868 /NCGR_PEP_ID=MMETSP0156-20130528/27002_1 /TAXON_ID=33649 /ORGANISM="Thalassionema nitzschioides, Strain L26-B" /LENGTH=494 /DNA_ID=CAMNT_0038949681 /DNA_START=92 /DNA_END=1576 /DNA_ORIENTATION=+
MRTLLRHLTAAGQNDEENSLGVNTTYEDLYHSFVFLTVVWAAGQIASSKYLKMPPLVGEIIAGILLGPPVANFVPDPEAWLLLGQIGLILLVVEAGIDIDIATLKRTGLRGLLIACLGSILPIGIGIILAMIIHGTEDMKQVIAIGATFGSSSLGIALNTLKVSGILNTPVGQLIVSAAVLDDMIALIVLSFLESLTEELKVSSILIPILSAVGFLLIGGYVALFVIPVINKKWIMPKFEPESHGKVKLIMMFCVLLIMMPATFYGGSSYLMGAFLSGLAFCQSIELQDMFTSQFKRVLSWLMRIFFAASIGFQVPMRDFGKATVIWHGIVYTFALLGKLAVGWLVPNFTNHRNYRGTHLRDILITGFTMASEGEFAFVIAVFSVDVGLTTQDTYASVVLAVLISAIVPPLGLRWVLATEWGDGDDNIDDEEKGCSRSYSKGISTLSDEDQSSVQAPVATKQDCDSSAQASESDNTPDDFDSQIPHTVSGDKEI